MFCRHSCLLRVTTRPATPISLDSTFRRRLETSQRWTRLLPVPARIEMAWNLLNISHFRKTSSWILRTFLIAHHGLLIRSTSSFGTCRLNHPLNTLHSSRIRIRTSNHSFNNYAIYRRARCVIYPVHTPLYINTAYVTSASNRLFLSTST